MSSESKLAIVSAIGGNTVVAVSKFGAFAFTGSGSMLSEAIHSVADVINQVLLFIGLVRGSKEADAAYQYGYGRERYIWALMSAVGIFFLGCGVTIYHGIQSLLHPHALSDLGWAFAVLAFSFAIEFSVLAIAYRGLKKSAAGQPFLTYLKTEADPGTVAVLTEDSAACTGIVIAFLGIVLTDLTGNLYWDAVGSILIGVLLGFVAIWLIMRNHHILVGHAVPGPIEEKVRAIVEGSPLVESIETMKTEMIDNETFDFTLEVDFDGARVARKLEPMVEAAWETIETREDFIAFTHQYADDVLHELGDAIDRLEEKIRRAVPQAVHLDVEPD